MSATYSSPAVVVIESDEIHIVSVGEQGPAGAGGSGEEGGVSIPGASAYDLWLAQGNVGTVDDFLASLEGPQGPKGDQGIQGIQGPKGDKGDTGATGPAGSGGSGGYADTFLLMGA